MQATRPITGKTYHHWTPEEKMELSLCQTAEDQRALAEKLGIDFGTVQHMHRHYFSEHLAGLPVFDYKLIRPLKALFSRCPVCGGTTTVDNFAYCRSCWAQWHPITLQPITFVQRQGNVIGLHKPEFSD